MAGSERMPHLRSLAGLEHDRRTCGTSPSNCPDISDRLPLPPLGHPSQGSHPLDLPPTLLVSTGVPVNHSLQDTLGPHPYGNLGRGVRVPRSPMASGFLAARRGLRLKVCFVPGLLSPSIWQARRTWLFLPINARHWPEPTRRRVLLHELGHVHGRDGRLMMVWRVLDVFHWWNPCWWRLRSQWELSLECAADDWVVQWCPGETRDYARMLVDLATLHPSTSSMPALGGGRLESRIRRLLTPRETRTPWHRIRSVAGWLSTGILSTWILIYPPCGAPQPPEAPSPNEVERRLAADPFPQRN